MWATLHKWKLTARWLFHMTFCFRDVGAGRTLSLKQTYTACFFSHFAQHEMAILTHQSAPWPERRIKGIHVCRWDQPSHCKLLSSIHPSINNVMFRHAWHGWLLTICLWQAYVSFCYLGIFDLGLLIIYIIMSLMTKDLYLAYSLIVRCPQLRKRQYTRVDREWKHAQACTKHQ